MIRNYSRLLFSFFAFSLFCSCEDVVDLPVQGSPKLVVFSNFSDKSLEVYVYKTQSVLTEGPTEYIQDAEVEVYTDGNLIETLELEVPVGSKKLPPFYKTKNLVPVFDKEYTIMVRVDGFQPISAKNSIPTPVPIESVDFSNTVVENEDFNLVVNFNVAVTLKDPSNIANFYHLKFHQELTPYMVGMSGDTVFGESYLAFPSAIQAMDANTPVFKYVSDQSFLMDDIQFDGTFVTLSFSGQYTFDPKKFVPGRFLVELRTVSEAYYLYHYTLNKQNQNNNPLGDGVVVYNNIENGVGNFSGFTSTFNSFKLTD
ncbi:MAG: DUF4249 domain-containing protein [Bacteroidetes bacterium]|nr:DUF4249 domain-containing protein [Bacteroidota bacterium]